MKRSRTRKRHRDLAFLASRCAPRRFKRAIEVGECRTGACKEGATGVSQLNSARHAAEQLYVDFLLDRLDQAAERRLRNAKALRRAGDVPFFRDSDDVAEMPEFHSHTPQGMKIVSNISWLNGIAHANPLTDLKLVAHESRARHRDCTEIIVLLMSADTISW